MSTYIQTVKITKKRTHIYFDSFLKREAAIDFLLKMNAPFTYVKAFPKISVAPSVFKKLHLDLYLDGILRMVSTFNYKIPG